MRTDPDASPSYPPAATPPAPLRADLRAEWLLKPDLAFLNHGSFGAVPRVVMELQSEWRRRIEAAPVEWIARRGEELTGQARRVVGQWLGMAGPDFGFVTNATEGVNAVLRSLDLRPGEELVTTDHVYHAVRQAMRYVAHCSGASVREIPVPLPVESAEQIAGAVLAGLTERTRLLVIDHVTSPTGLAFPVGRIVAGCAARGVDVLVDGAHAPGMLDLDVPATGTAYYAGNLHKWGCAPRGSAFLWVCPDRQAIVHPTVISHAYGDGFAKEFAWQGTRDFSNWPAVPRAIGFLGDLGWPQVRAHNHAMAVWAHRLLCDQWGVEPISPLDGRLLGSMATVPLPPPLDGMSEEEGAALQQRLYTEHRVEAPIVRFNGRWFTRASCHVYNRPEEYERLADAILEEAARRRRGT